MKQNIDQFLPPFKSWIIRNGFLDIRFGYDDIIKYLDKEKNLGGDAKALQRIAKVWGTDESHDVGESGSIYRIDTFNKWLNNEDYEIIVRKTLIKRSKTKMCTNPEIVNWPLEKLLTLDGNPKVKSTPEAPYPGTSQWGTAFLLSGNEEQLRSPRMIANPPFYLEITYDALEHWTTRRDAGQTWDPILDITLRAQAEGFVELYTAKQQSTEKRWKPTEKQKRDCDLYCFYRGFDYMTTEQGMRKWPHIVGHETDRFEEMDDQLPKYRKGELIDSEDHRVVQTLAMKMMIDKLGISVDEVRSYFAKPDAVDKTWPLFWDFLEVCTDL